MEEFAEAKGGVEPGLAEFGFEGVDGETTFEKGEAGDRAESAVEADCPAPGSEG